MLIRSKGQETLPRKNISNWDRSCVNRGQELPTRLFTSGGIDGSTFYLVLETSYYTKQQCKAFRSLQAYNQMVSGFISSVQGHIVKDNCVVLAKVRHSQGMNDSLIPVWIITEKQGTIISAHCCGCKAGLGESCSHVASVLFYLEAWTKINGKNHARK